MALYLIIGSRDLRARVTAACGSFYMPFARCALVPFDGTAEQLARRLILLGSEHPPRRSGHRLRPLKHSWVVRIFLS
ncbi:MAG TPA: hypothetical protein VHA35_11690 [Dongiaceae bacterium]|nr:hypothetical protein [Dongiaceae bacterium]